MSTAKVISLFTFGIFLLLVGGISKFFNWSQSNLLIALGLIFELLAALLFMWNKIKK